MATVIFRPASAPSTKKNWKPRSTKLKRYLLLSLGANLGLLGALFYWVVYPLSNK